MASDLMTPIDLGEELIAGLRLDPAMVASP